MNPLCYNSRCSRVTTHLFDVIFTVLFFPWLLGQMLKTPARDCELTASERKAWKTSPKKFEVGNFFMGWWKWKLFMYTNSLGCHFLKICFAPKKKLKKKSFIKILWQTKFYDNSMKIRKKIFLYTKSPTIYICDKILQKFLNVFEWRVHFAARGYSSCRKIWNLRSARMAHRERHYFSKTCKFSNDVQKV